VTQGILSKRCFSSQPEAPPCHNANCLFNEQGAALDKAGSLFDAAETLQKRRAAEAQAAMNKDLAAIDC
jgi:hypothetical protein